MAYEGFKKLKEKLSKEKGVKDAGAIAASVMRKKYKKADITKHEQSGTSLEHAKPKKHFGF